MMIPFLSVVKASVNEFKAGEFRLLVFTLVSVVHELASLSRWNIQLACSRWKYHLDVLCSGSSLSRASKRVFNELACVMAHMLISAAVFS